MKTIPAALEVHYALGATTFAHGLLVTREDAEVFAFLSDTTAATIDGQYYDGTLGLELTQIVVSAGAAVGNMELTALRDGTVFKTAEIFAGVWKKAAFEIFRYDRTTPGSGRDVLLAGVLGEVRLFENKVVAELRDLRQYLQQPLGSNSSKLCRYRFGYHDTGGLNGASRCGVDILGSPGLTGYGTVSVRDSDQHFRAAAMTGFSEHAFTDGIVTFHSGLNAGFSMQIKTHMYEGSPSQLWFTLQQAMPYAIAAGDTFTAEFGCRKRLEDCIAFGNVLNFGGEPHRPGMDALMSAPTVAV